MSDLNKTMIIGRLGMDPEVRYTTEGKAVANLSVATTEVWTGKDGKKKEKTEWHRVVAFNKLAEICAAHLKKGRQVYIEGKNQTRQWEDKDGNKRYTTEVVARDISFLGTKPKDDSPTSDDTPPVTAYDLPQQDSSDDYPF